MYTDDPRTCTEGLLSEIEELGNTKERKKKTKVRFSGDNREWTSERWVGFVDHSKSDGDRTLVYNLEFKK